MVMVLTAAPVADALGGPEATPVIQVMSATILLAGIGVVPYAKLQRNFQQNRLFAIDATSFVIATVLTIALAAGGHGAMSLAIGRVAARSSQ